VLISRQTEAGTDEDGTIELTVLQVFDENQLVYISVVDKKKKDATRCYCWNGKTAVEEVDTDGSGFFNALVIFDENELPISGFERGKDSSIRLFSKERLSQIKKGFSWGTVK